LEDNRDNRQTIGSNSQRLYVLHVFGNFNDSSNAASGKEARRNFDDKDITHEH